ncbi:MAG TPA: regulatory protein RecX [Spirochaetota bacterium]|nr:regulatory protein RecX [Spirochaetota bacterium]
MFGRRFNKTNPFSEDYEKAYEQALRFIEYSPQMEKPLFMKLIKKGYAISVVKKVTDRLKEVGLLDDKAVSKNYIDSLISSKLYGYNLIVKKLVEKGIDLSEASRFAKEGFERNEEEAVIIEKFIRKNITTFKELYTENQTNKIIFKLQSKGYSHNKIEKAVDNLKNILKEDDDE